MYQPAHFSPTDPGAARALMREHPLALLVWSDAAGALHADPVPMMLDDDGGPHGALRAHVARANPLWQLAAGRPVMAVFQGPQGYITPNWYPSKAENPRTVPTWNYALVQAHGTLQVHEQAAWLLPLVTRLTQRHEASQPHPWQVSDAPDDYISRMLGAIVGIEIPVQRLDTKFKLSQNRSQGDRAGVLAGLAQQGGDENADLARLTRASEPPA